MSDQGTNGPAPTLEEVQEGLLRAIVCATNDFCIGNSEVPMEGAAKAALEFAQAYVILNPSMGPNGVPLEHEVNMEGLRAAHERAKAAAAPSPAKGAKP